MLVLLSTYKRLDVLEYALVSLIEAEQPKLSIGDSLRLAIHNNFYPDSEKIIELINRVKENHPKISQWEIIRIDRQPMLPPFIGWYDVVDRFAKKDEVVIFCCDDDLITSWSLKERYKWIIKKNADFLLGRMSNSIYFDMKNKTVNFKNLNIIYKENIYPEKVNISQLNGYCAVAVSNTCFRYTEIVTKSIDLAMEWCNSDTDIELYYRTCWYSFYLPLAILIEKGIVLGIDQELFFRGRDIREIRETKFGTATFVNFPYQNLCAYDILNRIKILKNNPELEEFKKDLLSNGIKKHFFQLFLNSKNGVEIDKQNIKKMLKQNSIKILLTDILLLINSFKIVLKSYLKLNGLCLHFRFLTKMKSMKVEKFIEKFIENKGGLGS